MSTSTSRGVRFNLRSVLALFALLALLLVCGKWLYEWYYATPTVPLADFVATFNAAYAHDDVGQFEPALTEAEVLTAIRVQLANLQASDQVKSIYARILRTQRVPQNASLDAMTRYSHSNASHFTVWWINLEVKTGANRGYGLRIRENNSPVAKPKGEKPLTAP